MKQESKLRTLGYKMATFVIPDSLYIRLKYRKNFGRWPNLKNPRTFNEKLNWLKLNDHNPLYTTMVDKYSAKEYVTGIIGKEYIIPTYGVWDKAEEIDFDSLPEKFVLKATHDSGRVIICHDKSKLDRGNAIAEMKKSLRRNFYAVTREWPYKNVKPRIIAEQLLQTDDGDELMDYKFYCFNGEPKMVLIAHGRFSSQGVRFDYYDIHHNLLPFEQGGKSSGVVRPFPATFEKMKDISRLLSKGLPHARIDLYEVQRKVYFGEITFYDSSGMEPFNPTIWDYKLGEWIDLGNVPDKMSM